MLLRIDRILLRVPNVSAAVKLYQGTFGLTLVRQQARVASLRYPQGETELVVHDDPDLPAYAIYHLVDDVRRVFEQRETLGLRFIEAPTPTVRGTRASVRDRLGNVFDIIDHSAGAAGRGGGAGRGPGGGGTGGRRHQDAGAQAGRVNRACDELGDQNESNESDASAGQGGTADSADSADSGDSGDSADSSDSGDSGDSRGSADSGDSIGIAGAVEDGRRPDALFAGAAVKPSSDPTRLAALYAEMGRTADDLPYTPHFETLLSAYTRALAPPLPDHAEVWRQLLRLRKKKGKLTKLGAARSKPPAIDPAHREHLRTLLGPDIGRRDRLPYTPRFDQLVSDFNRQFARPYSPHVVWRLLATLAK